MADLYRLVAELEQRLESSFTAHDEAIARADATAQENARLRHELGIARERQNASADILGTIANASGDAEASLQRIAETTARLFDAASVAIRIADGNEWGLSIRFGAGSERIAARVPEEQRRVGGRNLPGTVFRENRQIHIPDLDNIDPEMADWPVMMARAAGTRTVAGTPLRREGKAIGALIVYRDRLAPFTDEELALLQSFADQAVIAIENARLFNETREALSRQTATADILRAISQSPTDVQPVFDAIVLSAVQLLGCDRSFMLRCDGTSFWSVARAGTEGPLPITTPLKAPIDPDANFPSRAIVQRKTLHLPDWSVIDLPEFERGIHKTLGYNSTLYLPLLRGAECVGLLGLARKQAGVFDENEIALAESFRDQALIAIENTRLFNETTEALERQTATSDILKVIASSPSDVQPVFEAIATSANKLIGGFSTAVLRFTDGIAHLAAFTPANPAADEVLKNSFPLPLAAYPPLTMMQKGETVQIADTETVEDFQRKIARARGFRSIMLSPLMSNRAPIGLISVTRVETGSFADHHVQLLQTFADQAVIAIENARLFNETTEALERQTATSDILKVIASSPSDVQPVFDVIVERAVRLCGARMGRVYRYDGDLIHLVGGHGLIVPGREGAERPFPRPASDDTIVGRVMLARRPNILADLNEDNSVPELSREMISALGARSQVTMPMLLAGEPIGAITLSWAEPRGYTDQTIALLQTFADQAVIAIENVRLFNETREALERQTATADILKVIASAPSDVQPVFEAIVDSSKRLLGGFSAAVFRFIDGIAYLEAITPTNPAADEIMKNSFPRPVTDFSSFAMVQGGRIVQIPDTEALSDDIRDIARARGFRSMLIAPLMSSGTPIGMVSVTRVQAGTFAAHHEQLLQTFADQAVIAIENTRLFNEVQQRTNDLSESLQQQTAVGDVLKIISRSAFDLQPVLDTLVNTAAILCDAEMAFLMRREGDVYRAGAAVGYSPEYIDFLRNHPLSVDRGTITGRAVLERHTVQILDVATDPEYTLRESTTLANQHTALCVPLLRENEPIGTIVLARQRVESFTQKQIDLVTTFADQAVIAIENVRLFEQLRQRTEDLGESLQQQTATADVLKVISRSAFDLQPVLDTLTESAARLCNAEMAAITRQDSDGGYYHATNYNFSVDWLRVSNSLRIRPERGSLVGRVLLASKAVQIIDVLADPEYAYPEQQEAAGYRTLLGVPLLRLGQPIGVLFLGRKTVEPFSEKQIELVSTFADQAVIAIENVRLFDEVQAKTRDLSEALTYQTGSANILKVIASSPTEVGPVLQAIVENACELCEANDAIVLLENAGELHSAAHHGPIPEGPTKLAITRSRIVGRAFLDRRPVHVRDFHSAEGAEFPDGQELARRMGHRTMLAVPLLREGESIGVIALRCNEVRPFSDKQINLLQTFADQAVIAIGNVRLFEEVQARTRDLSESLQQQTATADVLKVISRSAFDLQTVFQALVESAAQLCRADRAAILRLRDNKFQVIATHGFSPEFRELMFARGLDLDRGSVAGRAALERRAVQVPDILADPEFTVFESQRRGGFRTVLGVPLLREGNPIGALFLTRGVVELFTQQQVDLVTTFADQAVIAIENARLFDEVQARTQDLSEALTYQTGSANILKVIASSPTDVKPVLKAIVESACELCEANDALATLKDGDDLLFQAQHGSIPVVWDRQPINRQWVSGRAVIDRQPVHVHDLLTAEGEGFPNSREFSQRTNVRTVLSVPLLREGESIGAIVLRRTEVRPFGDKQIALLQTFADQAVIAIGNVQLFEEVQARTRDLSESLQQQIATADVLKVISASPGELEPVFQAMLENAVRLCEAKFAMLFLYQAQENEFRAVGKWNLPPAWSEFLRKNPLRADPRVPLGQVAMMKQPIQIPDVLEHQAYIDRYPGMVAVAELGGARTLLQVPLLKENELVGAFGIYRQEVRPFTDKQIALVRNFAAQAVIAIENARLLNELRQRTDDLTESLHDLRTAQDRLIQTEKLASLGQLTAGIAHEIKNPLNFVNNFAALSAELTDELNDTLMLAGISDKIREEVDELTSLLKDNLEKVVQHGKRADSIVKNMLLHSREGSGEHRPTDINALIDESLNLAYHGARAERPDFNVAAARLRSRSRLNCSVSAGNHPRVPQFGLERLLRREQAQARGRSVRFRSGASRSHPQSRRRRRDPHPRQRHRHSTGREGQDVQPVLHHKTRGRRHRPWPVDEPRHHRETTRWYDRRRY